MLVSSARSADFISPPPWSNQINSDIKRFISEDEIRPLLVDEVEFISLYRQHMAPQQRGVALIIPDWQHLPTNNAGINFLRKELNDVGYATIATTIPDIDWLAVDKADSENDDTDAASSTEEPAADVNQTQEITHAEASPAVSNAIIDHYKSNLIARFNALYQSASNEQGKIIVVAQGASAGLLLEHFASFPRTNIDAFISLSSYLPNQQRNQNLNASLSTISPPLLDIYYSVDNPDLTHSVEQRKRWVRRNSKYDYRQRELFGLPAQPEQHQRLLKEIDGFLRRLF
uniref:DUF3530 family protein n=1 Tax=Pseudoalteromonas mariniglutinosa TaxID=206042 RepID=UPI00387F5686